MKRTSLALCMMGLVLGAAACQTSPSEPEAGPALPAQAHEALADSSPALPKVQISFAPGDLTSATSETPITIFVENGTQAVDDALLEKIASQIELRTYPDLAAVDAEIHVIPSARQARPVRSGNDKSAAASEPLRGNPGRASLLVRPLRPLAAQWHVVSLARLPEGTRPVAWTGVEGTALGAFAARFHPGSAPVVREVRLCEKQDGRAARVIATFSEGLRVDPSRAAKLVRAGDARSGEACTVVTPAAADVPQTMLEIDCPASVLKTGSIDLGLSTGLVSMSGAPLTSIEAGGRPVDFHDAIDFSEAGDVAGCRTVTMQ